MSTPPVREVRQWRNIGSSPRLKATFVTLSPLIVDASGDRKRTLGSSRRLTQASVMVRSPISCFVVALALQVTVDQNPGERHSRKLMGFHRVQKRGYLGILR